MPSSGTVEAAWRPRRDLAGLSDDLPFWWTGGVPFPDGTDRAVRNGGVELVGVSFFPTELHGRSTVVRIVQAAIAQYYF